MSATDAATMAAVLADVLAEHFESTRSVDGTLNYGWCAGGDSYGTKHIGDHNAHVATALLAAPPIAQALAAVEAVARVEALADKWAEFEHDAVACPKYDCGNCTMLNAIYDLRAALRPSDGPQ